MKRAIADHSLGRMVKRVSQANAAIRRSVSLNETFKDNNCRQRCESATRWSWVKYFAPKLQ
jgi:hypothetical protein